MIPRENDIEDAKVTDREKIIQNKLGNVHGKNISITQNIATASATIQSYHFELNENPETFSIEWLSFHQRSVPLFGRCDELEQLKKFLNDPKPFAWWAIVGSGGSGKSRLALEFLKSLPPNWSGGFVRQELATLESVANWKPEQDHLWIIDYAASNQNEIKSTIAAWANVFRSSLFNVRLLLLERDYDDSSGWWSEITRPPSVVRFGIEKSLYAEPLRLPPFGNHTEQFLEHTLSLLDRDLQESVRHEVEKLTSDEISNLTEHGNPLLVQLLVSNIIEKTEGRTPETTFPRESVQETYLLRELDILRDRCESDSIDFQKVLDLLFVTTSAFPLPIPDVRDSLVLADEDGGVLFVTDADGQSRLPEIGEIEFQDFDILANLKQELTNNLRELLRFSDIDAQFSVLQEIGLGHTSRYSLQPDLLGESLFRLILNSPSVSKRLVRRRREFSRARASELIMCACAIGMDNAVANWARLDDDTISLLVLYTRESGASIRWPLLLLRKLNENRSAKTRFDTDLVFSDSGKHPAAAGVGDYYNNIIAEITHGVHTDSERRELALSEHSWVLPYIDFLEDLSLSQRTSLCRIISHIKIDTHSTHHVSDIKNCIAVYHSFIAHRLSSRTSDPEPSETEFVSTVAAAAVTFSKNVAHPVMATIDFDEFDDVVQAFASLISTLTYGFANHQFGRGVNKEQLNSLITLASDARVYVEHLDDTDSICLWERNLAALVSVSGRRTDAVMSAYDVAVGRICRTKSTEQLSGALRDYIITICEYGDIRKLDSFSRTLRRLQGSDFDPASFLSYLLLLFSQCGEQLEQWDKSVDVFSSLFDSLFKGMTGCKDTDATNEFATLFNLANNHLRSADGFEKAMTGCFKVAAKEMRGGVSPEMIDGVLLAYAHFLGNYVIRNNKYKIRRITKQVGIETYLGDFGEENLKSIFKERNLDESSAHTDSFLASGLTVVFCVFECGVEVSSSLSIGGKFNSADDIVMLEYADFLESIKPSLVKAVRDQFIGDE